MFDQNMSNGFDFDSTVMGNNNVVDNDMNVDINMMGNNMGEVQAPMMNGPISEGVQEKCIHKTIVHEVPHVGWGSDNIV